ncbi:hypothetical protein AG1IA_00539 [Rhizoctonia solani AG-1 IA]|uniref:Uncharacterized protein n=1 Tax=Thanatephorus cucumeris (strain AG1-IA) TaxID=983506 RepID=L8X8L5_THACA|nr:hypothetical protein AG1IA_00539 [Rhizoctonia solani AG-1 IA]
MRVDKSCWLVVVVVRCPDDGSRWAICVGTKSWPAAGSDKEGESSPKRSHQTKRVIRRPQVGPEPAPDLANLYCYDDTATPSDNPLRPTSTNHRTQLPACAYPALPANTLYTLSKALPLFHTPLTISVCKLSDGSRREGGRGRKKSAKSAQVRFQTPRGVENKTSHVPPSVPKFI